MGNKTKAQGKRKIEPVKSNEDKRKTYQEHISKYNIAVENECYFEAILITYAMIEDRLRSYLYHMGCLKSRSSHEFDNDMILGDIELLVGGNSDEAGQNLGITNISGKIRIIEAVHKWYKKGCPNLNGSAYLDELAACIDIHSDSAEMLDTLKKLKEWCRYRNEIIHALLNKNLDSLYKELPQQVKDGMALARIIDKHVNRLKDKNDSLRRFLNLEEN